MILYYYMAPPPKTQVSPPRGIIQRMLIWRVYWLVRFIDKKYQDTNDWVLCRTVLRYYTKHKNRFFIIKYDAHHFNKICNYALREKYLDNNKYVTNGPPLYLTSKGEKLIDLPLGTLQSVLAEYGLAFTFMGSLIIAIAGQWHNLERFMRHLIQ